MVRRESHHQQIVSSTASSRAQTSTTSGGLKDTSTKKILPSPPSLSGRRGDSYDRYGDPFLRSKNNDMHNRVAAVGTIIDVPVVTTANDSQNQYNTNNSRSHVVGINSGRPRQNVHGPDVDSTSTIASDETGSGMVNPRYHAKGRITEIVGDNDHHASLDNSHLSLDRHGKVDEQKRRRSHLRQQLKDDDDSDRDPPPTSSADTTSQEDEHGQQNQFSSWTQAWRGSFNWFGDDTKRQYEDLVELHPKHVRKISVRPQLLSEDGDTASSTTRSTNGTSYYSSQKTDTSKGTTPLKPPKYHDRQGKHEYKNNIMSAAEARLNQTNLFVETGCSSPTTDKIIRHQNNHHKDQRDENIVKSYDEDEMFASTVPTPRMSGGNRDAVGPKNIVVHSTKSMAGNSYGNFDDSRERPYSCTAIDSSYQPPRGFSDTSTRHNLWDETQHRKNKGNIQRTSRSEVNEADSTTTNDDVSEESWFNPKYGVIKQIEQWQQQKIQKQREQQHSGSSVDTTFISRVGFPPPRNSLDYRRDFSFNGEQKYCGTDFPIARGQGSKRQSCNSQSKDKTDAMGILIAKLDSLRSPNVSRQQQRIDTNMQKTDDNMRSTASSRSTTLISSSFDTCRSQSALSSSNKQGMAVQSENRPDRAGSPNSKSLPSLDQRTVRLLYASEFVEMMNIHSTQVNQILAEHIAKPSSQTSSSQLSFVVRKRPLLETELENDFDVVDTPSEYPSAVVLYECSIHAEDRKTRDVAAHLFRMDHVFSPEVSFDQFYEKVAQPLLGYLNGAVLSIGYEGSGNSETVTEIGQRLAHDVFSDAFEDDSIFLEALSITGNNNCIDLLGGADNVVSIVPSKVRCRFKGAKQLFITSPEQMQTSISNAKRRAAHGAASLAETDSEESILVLRITIADDERAKTILLVDAGLGSSSSVGKSTSQILEVLHNIRYISHAPTATASQTSSHEHNLLMKILKPLLESQSSKSRLCVVGNISPASSDTEVTLSTLLTLKTTMKGWGDGSTPNSQEEKEEEEALVLPRHWTHDQLMHFLYRKRMLQKQVPAHVTGRTIMRMGKRQLQETFFEGETGKAEKLFLALRAENDRIARLRVKKKLAEQKKSKVH